MVMDSITKQRSQY